MNADVAAVTSVHPWNKIPNLSCQTSTAWIFPSAPPVRSPLMEPGGRWPAAADEPDGPAAAQLDFFHKLGYSTAQVHSVQRKFGPNMDTDKVLGELVRIGAGQEAKRGPPTTMSVLVPSGEPPAPGAALLLPVAPRSREEGGEDEGALRPVVIDGSNVAMSHGNKEVFSCLGIQLAVNYFLDRGHAEITVFVPSWRKEKPRPDVPITDQQILRELEKKKHLVFTPSRHVAGKRVVCNDDFFIVQLAYESDGVIVSNDMYRDLQGEKPELKRFIEENLLMYSFVNDKFMPPDDPLGRHGPTLENFLRRFPKTQKKQPCPYGKKCTYGIKCKFSHPERSRQSNRLLADALRDNAKLSAASTASAAAAAPPPSSRGNPVPGQSLSLVEDMARKLTLGHDGGPPKKDHKASRRASSRREKGGPPPHSEPGSPWQSGSQEQLDSGLGSIDSQPMEAPRSYCERQYGPAPAGLLYYPHRSPPCSCCSHSPPSQRATPSFQHPRTGLGCDAYEPPRYGGYGGYPVSMPAYGPPADFRHSHVQQQQQMYWSDPFGAHPPGVHALPPWEPLPPPQGTPHGPNPGAKEREVVRKKLLAIFSAQLVDAAMDKFPQLMDPQMLAAEILMLQSQSRLR